MASGVVPVSFMIYDTFILRLRGSPELAEITFGGWLAVTSGYGSPGPPPAFPAPLSGPAPAPA